MTLLFDSDVFTRGECRNLAFRKKITQNAIQAMLVAAGIPTQRFSLYDFMDDAGFVGAINKGTSGVLGNMAWDNIGLRTGNGWYVHPVPAAEGLGMVNDGGVSNYIGSVADHNGNNMSGVSKATWVFVFRANSAGEGNFGRLIEKTNGYRVNVSAANTMSVAVWDGGTYRIVTTGASVVYGFWNVLVFTFDGTEPVATDRLKAYLNGIEVTTAPSVGTPATITDDGNILYVLDRADNTRAWDGELGSVAIIPGLTMSLAQVQSLVELRGLFQPLANNRALITPSLYGPPQYDFDGAADPNTDHFLTFQVTPLKTNQGTAIIWFSPENFAAFGVLFDMTENGVAINDSYRLPFRGDGVGDPMDIIDTQGGANSWIGRTAGNLINPELNMVAIRSDGATTRMNINGVDVALANIVGANTGTWFSAATDANAFVMGVARNAVLGGGFRGPIQKLLIYDRPLSPDTIARIQRRGWAQYGPRWYPSA